MKFKVNIDEEWPVFTIDKIKNPRKNEPYEVEISQELYDEYILVMASYDDLQLKLKGLYDKCTNRVARSFDFRVPEDREVE